MRQGREHLQKRSQINMGYLVSIFFFIALSPRLSVLLEGLIGDVSPRIFNKLLWVLMYLMVLAVTAYLCYFSGVNVVDVARRLLYKYKVVLYSALVFLGGVVISTLFGVDVFESFMGFVYYALIVSILAFTLFIFEVFPTVRNHFKYGIIVSALLLSIIALTQALDHRVNQNLGYFVDLFNPAGLALVESFNIRTSDIGIFLRPSSLMVDTNVFAVFMVIAIAIGIKLFLEKKRWWLLPSLLLYFFVLMLTASRTGLLVLVVTVLGYYILQTVFKKRSRDRLFSVAPLSLILSRLGLNDYSAFEHLNYWIQSIKIFLQYPLFGIGVGNFPGYYRSNINSNVDFATAHSVYAKLLAEGGLVVILPFLLFIFAFVKKLLENRNALYTAIFLALFAGNVTYDFFLTPWVWMILGLLVGEDGKIS